MPTTPRSNQRVAGSDDRWSSARAIERRRCGRHHRLRSESAQRTGGIATIAFAQPVATPTTVPMSDAGGPR